MAKKSLVLFLVLILGVVTLAGCRGADPDDPNLGLWKATKAEQNGMSLDLKALFGQGCTIELNTKNVCTVSIDGVETAGAWTLIAGNFAIKCNDFKLQGIMAKGVLTIQDFLGVKNLNIIFEKEGGHPDASPSTASNDERPESAGGINLSEGLEWWDGQWYGWYRIVDAHGQFSSIEGLAGDCFTFIDMKSNGTGTLYFWDLYQEKGIVDIAIDTDAGEGLMGTMQSVSGTMMLVPVEKGEWFADPSLESYENLLYIEGSVYFNDDERAGYEIYLRPWGMRWDDMPADLRPVEYDAWYIGDEIINYESMLDAIADSVVGGEEAHIHSALPDRAFS